MPELPEVEVVRMGITPLVQSQVVQRVLVRQRQLRWPVSRELERVLTGQVITHISRRSKYLILHCDPGVVLIHLGMSGVLSWLPHDTPVRAHDHLDIQFAHGLLRLNDPRRFGAVLWIPGQRQDPASLSRHPLLAKLGPEPFSDDFTALAMWTATRGRRVAIKQALLGGELVVGVGNIYASEALFQAGIDPRRAVGRISRARYEKLAEAIRRVLSNAIEHGGSTLRDFRASDGQSGYFQIAHQVYDRAGLSCLVCSTPIRHIVQGQRSTYFCPNCQR